MPEEHVISIDPARQLADEPATGHNRCYALCSVAVDLRISQTVDVPNLLVSALLPLDIFM